jgi:hypothetical protein
MVLRHCRRATLTERPVTHLYIVLFGCMVMCIEAGLSVLRTPNPEVAAGETEAFDRLPPAF